MRHSGVRRLVIVAVLVGLAIYSWNRWRAQRPELADTYYIVAPPSWLPSAALVLIAVFVVVWIFLGFRRTTGPFLDPHPPLSA